MLKWQRLNSRAFGFTLELSIDYTPRYFSCTPRISSVFFNFSSVLVNFISEFNACSIWLADLSRFNEIKRVLMSGLNRFLIIFFELANLHASEYRLSGTYAMSFQFYAPLRPTEFDPYLSLVFALPWIYLFTTKPVRLNQKFSNCGHGHEIFETAGIAGIADIGVKLHWLLVLTWGTAPIAPDDRTLSEPWRKWKNDHFSNFFVGVFLCNFCFDSFQKVIFVVKNF